ncbi:hypothetical protein TCAL_11817, partial [Tigriopus californicus]
YESTLVKQTFGQPWLDPSDWKFKPKASQIEKEVSKPQHKVSFREAAVGIKLGLQLKHDLRDRQLVRVLNGACLDRELSENLASLLLHCEPPPPAPPRSPRSPFPRALPSKTSHESIAEKMAKQEPFSYSGGLHDSNGTRHTKELSLLNDGRGVTLEAYKKSAHKDKDQAEADVDEELDIRQDVEQGTKTRDDMLSSSYDYYDSDDLEAESIFQKALLDFTFRTEAVGQDELDEMTSGLMSGLKSWLSFGSSMAPSGGSFEADNQMASFLTTTQAALEMKRKGSNIYSLKTDDRLTKKAEEQAAKIAGEFCAWLRNLPKGTSDTVNTIPEDHIRALFDIGQAANPTKSKLAEGLMSWARFGQMAGPKDALASIASQQMSKQKFKKGVDNRKKYRRTSKRPKNLDGTLTGQKANSTTPQITGSNQSRSQWSNKGPILDQGTRQKRRQQYAGHVWHVHPTLWNKRLQQILQEHQHESSIEAVLASTIPAQQRPLVSSMERSNVNEILSSTSMNSESGAATGTKTTEENYGRAGIGTIGESPRLPRKSSKHQLTQNGRMVNGRQSSLKHRKGPDMEATDEEYNRWEENRRIAQLSSSKAFAEFLAKRSNYQLPPFLRDILPANDK